MKIVVALSAFLILAGPLWAVCPSVPRVRVVANKVVAVQQIVTPAVVAFPVVPTISGSYVHGVAQPAQQLQGISELVAAINRLAAAVERQNAQDGAADKNQPAAGDVTADFAAFLTGQCASCHRADTATKGGGMVLVEKDGKIPPFSLAEKKAIVRAVTSGEMPPKKTGVILSEDQKSVPGKFFNRQEAKKD